jgi:hypothetical protein
MSKNFSKGEGPSTASTVNRVTVAPVEVRHRHHQKVDPSTRQLQLHSSSGGVLHKMDRSEDAHQCELCVNQKIILAKHHMPIRRTQTHNSRQHKVLQQCNVQIVLSLNWDKHRIRISIPPTIKRSSREGQFPNIRSNEEDIGR